MARRPRITQKEVAAKANVSQTLVSLVLSGADFEVAEGTRKQILAAAKALGYQGKPRPKLTSRQRVIAYIRPIVERGHHPEAWIYDAYDDYYDRIQNFLLEEAYRQNYSLIVRPYQKSSELMQWLSEWELDGVIWHGQRDLVDWVAARHPTVQLFRAYATSTDAVIPNQDDTVRVPLDYLRSLGHERIAFLFKQIPGSPIHKARFRAYLEYLEETGIPLPETFLPETLQALQEYDDAEYFEQCYEGLKEILESKAPNRPTAVLTSDHCALYCMRRLQRAGVSLPEEMSFVGVDNISAAHLSYPALTSIDNRLSEIAQEAFTLLVNRIKGLDSSPRTISIAPTLIERDSVAPLRKEKVAPPPIAQSRGGFSLLQVIFSIVVIAALAVLLMAGVQSSQQKGREIRCLGNLRVIGSALTAYIAEHNGEVPAPYIGVSRPGIVRPNDPPADERIWTIRFLKLGYLESMDVFYCPSAKPRSYEDAKSVVSKGDPTKALMRGYGMRQWWFGNDFVQMASDPKKMSLIESPSEFYFVADSYWSEWGTSGYNLQPGSKVQRVHLRHQARANLLFLDGHVAAQDSAYFATLHELDRQGIYSGGDRAKNRPGHIHYTEPLTP